MKLLIVTQILDKDDPILGFFHRWVEEFARHVEQVTVICLRKGAYTLPDNVRVLSLGKEESVSRFEYIRRFFFYSWSERHSYDAVFTHMNPEYLILGAPLWRLMGKKIGMWYAHGTVSLKLRVATFLTRHVFTSTVDGFRLQSSKLHVVGQGIDCNHFVMGGGRYNAHAVTVGRISRVKNLEVLVETIAYLRKNGQRVSLDIFGTALTVDDVMYEQKLRELIRVESLEELIHIRGSISPIELPETLVQYCVFLNAGQTGSLDKAALEAAASGCIVVSSNPGIWPFLNKVSPDLAVENKPEAFAGAIDSIRKYDEGENQRVISALRQSVCGAHGITQLVSGILDRY